MKRGTLIALVVVIGLALVPEITGRIAESRVRELVAAFNRSGTSWRAAVTSHERGWIRSSSVVRFRLDGAIDVAEVRTSLRHAPLAGLHAAAGTSEVRLLQPMAEFARNVLGDAPLATASLTVGLGGTLDADLATPPIDRAVTEGSTARVSGSGSSGSLEIDRAGRFSFSHLYPKFTVTDGTSVVRLDALSLSSSGRLGDEKFAEPAQFSMGVKAVQAAHAAWAMAIADISFVARIVPNAESIDFKFGHTVGAGRIEQPGNAHRWNRIELQVTLADISRAAVEGYARDMRGVSDLPESDPRRVQLSLKAYSNAWNAVVARDPTLSLDTFTFAGPDGTLSISGTARVDRAAATQGGTDALPAAISMLARVSVSRALARTWIATALRPNAVLALSAEGGPPPPADEVARWSVSRADEVLGAAAAAGLIRDGADPIVIEIVAKDGRVLANGLTMDRIAELSAALLPPAARARVPR